MFTRPCYVPLSALLSIGLICSSAAGQYSKQMAQRGGYGGYSGGYGGYGGGGYGGGYSPYGNTASAHPGLGNPANLSLVIAQTQEGHEGVADLLEQLRRLQDQQVRIGTRFTTLNDSFYERIGVGFGFDIAGADPAGGRGVIGLDPLGQPTSQGQIEFRQGGAGSATPPFGGHDPASDGTVGFAAAGDEGALFFNFFGGQGSTRSLVTQEPIIVIPSGGNGTFSDTSQTPFVTGVIPVVGAPNMQAITGYGYGPVFQSPQQSVLEQKLQQLRYSQIREASAANGERKLPESTRSTDARPASARSADTVRLGSGGSSGPSSADRGDLSVAEIRRRQASSDASEDGELAAIIARARGAEAAGNIGAAKINYKMAVRRAQGEQKRQLIEKVRELEGQ